MKGFIQAIFHSLGYEINKWVPNKVESEIAWRKEREHQRFLQENKWLIEKNIKTIIDIGANEGQFAKKMRNLFPDAKIFSFEPIPQVYEDLKKNFADDVNFFAYNMGLGEEEGTLKFFLNEYSPSSSLLKMKDIHKENFPYTETDFEIEVLIKRLDDILDLKILDKPCLVKVDVQGFEEKVIRGGMNLIQKVDIIIIETSFVQLYDNGPLFDAIYTLLTKLGYSYIGNFEQLYSPNNHEILQADAIFKRI